MLCRQGSTWNRAPVCLLLLGSILMISRATWVELPASGQGKGKGAVADLWHLDYDQARAEARRTGKPLFVVFRCER